MATAEKPSLLSRFVAGAIATVATPVAAVSQNVVANAKAMGRSALDVTIFVLVGIVGYVFVMLGLAWLLARHLGMPATLLLIGGVHVVVGVIGVVVLVRRAPSEEPEPTGP
jgi:hypothetical protein